MKSSGRLEACEKSTALTLRNICAIIACSYDNRAHQALAPARNPGDTIAVNETADPWLSIPEPFMKKYYATILVVDDDPNDLHLTELALRKTGVTSPIHLCHDGEEAIAYMMGEGQYGNREKFAYPTFIITDLKMPHADGFAVLEHLKSNPEWAVIPTVVFSASEDLDDIKKSYMLGASSYHVKPQGLEALRAQMKVLHDYWLTCEVPAVDVTGRQLPTSSTGKLGERFSQLSGSVQEKRSCIAGQSGALARDQQRQHSNDPA